MNITLAIDKELVRKARKLAQQRGTSLNQVVREQLAGYVAGTEQSDALQRLEKLWAESENKASGWSWNREELYDRNVLR